MVVLSRLRRSLAAIAVLGIAAVAGFAGPVHQDISVLVSRTDMGGATIGVHAVDIDTGLELVSINADNAMIPASNMKLLTSGAALIVLGEEFVFRTQIRVDDSVSPPRLVLVGSGDPALGDPGLLGRDDVGITIDSLFDQIADALRNQGLTAVSEVVIDDRVFDRDFVHSNWPDDQLNRWYCAELGGLNFYTNVVSVFASPTQAGGTPTTQLVPDAPWIAMRNRGKSISKGRDTVWVARPRPDDSMTLFGNVRTRTEVEVAIHNPPMYAGRVIANELNRRGISVQGLGGQGAGYHAVRPVEALERFDDARAVAVITTPIADVLQRVNRDSQNMYAECLLKRMGHAVTGEPGSWANGAAVLRMTLSDAIGPDRASATTIDDGSGMSRGNRVQPSTFTEWMRWLAQDDHRWAMFTGSLATPGEGTFRRRFVDADLESELTAKSGYINGVYALSGVLTHPESGRRVAFSILLNDVKSGKPAQNAKPLHEQIVAELDEWLASQAPAASFGG